MILLNESLNIESVKLTALPEGGNCSAASGRLLVVWSQSFGSDSYVSSPESGEQYHLALYCSDRGWYACRWDKKHGSPFNVRLVSETAMWVSTTMGKLIYMSVEDEVKATMLASAELAEERFNILYADREDLWILGFHGTQIVRLRLLATGLKIINGKSIPYHVNASSIYSLADGAWVLVGDGRIYVFQSSSLEEEINEYKGEFFYLPPFLVRKDKNHLYYTEDPRHGWKEMPIKIEDPHYSVIFFARHDDAYYAAICRYLLNRVTLYCFSGESKSNAEWMWEISRYLRPAQFAEYNGLVCIVDEQPLVVSAHRDVPENHGFLVWDPRSNAFYEDIPEISIMHARRIIPHNLQIPKAWSDQDRDRHIQDVG